MKRLSEDQRKEYQEKWSKNEFSQYVSDLIPVHRDLPDYRSDKCRAMQYPENLPVMDVVMVFHNEAWSVLLRSVYSVLDRTAPGLLRNIVLVDDLSTMDHLKRPLEKYFLHHPKVKIIRMVQRGGLIKSRLRGFHATTAPVVVFLDSHIECTPGWAEPLLWLVAQDYRTVPFPVIDMIQKRTLGYTVHGPSPYGAFHINTLTFTWTHSLHRTPHPVTGARPSPTMPGGLFAISRKWFEELGTFDPELEYWGGENMELSFKTWMCGGSVVVADCSHIGHIFRSRNPIRWIQPLSKKNYVRVAMVWMDRYQHHYLETINYQKGDYGDLSERLALRQRLKCHSFDWYIDNVYPEFRDQLVLNATYAGEVRHEQSNMCLDKMDQKQAHTSPALYPCHRQGGNQFWYFREDRYLQAEIKYLCQKGPGTVGLCSKRSSAGEWLYDLTTRQLRHLASGQCLQKGQAAGRIAGVRPGHSRGIMLAPCQPSQTSQRWSLQPRRLFKNSS